MSFVPPIQDIKQFVQNDPSCIMEWKQTYEICKEALRHNIRCLPFIKEQTEKLILHAAIVSRHLYNDYNFINDIHNPTEELLIKVLKLSPHSIKFIENQTEILCVTATITAIDTFGYIKNPSELLLYKLVNHNPMNIIWMPMASLALQIVAITKNIEAIKIININGELSDELINVFVLLYPDTCLHVKQDSNIVKKALEINPKNIKYAKPEFLTYEICMNVIRSDNTLFEYIPKELHTQDMCLIAVEYVPNIEFMINPGITIINKALEIDKVETSKWVNIYIPGIKPRYCVKDILKADEMGEEFSLKKYPNRIDPVTGDWLVKGCLYGFIHSSAMIHNFGPNINHMELVGKYEDLRHFSKTMKFGSNYEYVFAPYCTLPIGKVLIHEITWIEY